VRTCYDHEPANRRIAESGGAGWDDRPDATRDGFDPYVAIDALLGGPLAVPGTRSTLAAVADGSASGSRRAAFASSAGRPRKPQSAGPARGPWTASRLLVKSRLLDSRREEGRVFDRERVRRYDQWTREAQASPEGSGLVEVRTGLFGRARVLPVSAEERPGCEEVEVAVAGAGPWGLVLGRLLAKRGHQVVVLERAPALGSGANWNLSRDELAALEACGAVEAPRLRACVRGDFSHGFFRIWDREAGRTCDFAWDELYNIALDDEAFLAALAEPLPGFEIRLGCTAALERVTRTGAYVDFRKGDGGAPAGVRGALKARLFVDARGWSSPLGRAANAGLGQEFAFGIIGAATSVDLPRELDAEGKPVGIHAATYGDEVVTAYGRVQPILERFSFSAGGRHGELINTWVSHVAPRALEPIAEQLVGTMAQVAPGFDAAQISQSYFGHIPGHHTGAPWARRRIQTSAGDRTLLVGCAGRQHSSLTGASFGPLTRNAAPLAERIHRALARDALTFRDLRRIDIDPAERVSQAVEGLFNRIMLLDDGEPEGTVNADWLAFLRAAEAMDPKLKNAAFRDQMRLKTLHQLVGLAPDNPEVVRAFVRNNRGALGAALGTLLWAYLALLLLELRRLVHGEGRRAVPLAAGVARLPLFVTRAVRLHRRARRRGRQEAEAKARPGGRNPPG